MPLYKSPLQKPPEQVVSRVVPNQEPREGQREERREERQELAERGEVDEGGLLVRLEEEIDRACKRLEEGGQGVAVPLLRKGFERAREDPKIRRLALQALRGEGAGANPMMMQMLLGALGGQGGGGEQDPLIKLLLKQQLTGARKIAPEDDFD